MRSSDVRLAVLAVVIAGGCVAAGVWQLQRLKGRRARNAVTQARLALPALAIHGPVPADSVRQRRVTAHGVYDWPAQRTWPGRSFEGTPGVALITPLKLADGSRVLVDRGWVYSPDAFHVDPNAYREADTATVEGIAFIPPRGRGDVDPTGFLPFVIQLERPAPPPATGLPRRWPAPVLDDGPHLSYAIQWFSFALIALVGTAALIRRGR
ncbi:MAG TPA: SURF1 family protein [Gemmatimonadales bacterium]|nr:SURF1 family protein [Gemmatimonadales bacterium]